MSRARFEVETTWNGEPLAAGEHACIELRIDRAAAELVLHVEAAFYDDPPPDAPPGPLDGLWDYEVVELFLLAEEERYLEIELGPHGHHLGLRLEGRRRVAASGIPIDFRTQRTRAGWEGEARLSLEWLPGDVRAANAYAMHGLGRLRRHLAAHPVPGNGPDFHRLEHFAPFRLAPFRPGRRG